MDDRYWFQPWYVKLWRHARYQPTCFFQFVWWFAAWLLKGAPPDDCGDGFGLSRRETAVLFYDLYRGALDCRLGRLYTSDEVRQGIKY